MNPRTHLVDWHDSSRRWACSCGYTAKTLPAVRRHARAANDAAVRAAR